MADWTRASSVPRTAAMAEIAVSVGSEPVRPSSRRTYVITDIPGALISFVARPAATRNAARGGSSGSTSSNRSGSTSKAAASLGTNRGLGRSIPDSHTLIRDGLDRPSAKARSSLVRPAASRAARRRSPRRSGRATAPPSPNPVECMPVPATLSTAYVQAGARWTRASPSLTNASRTP